MARKKKVAKKAGKEDTEKVVEVFEVEDNGKEKEVVVESSQEKEHSTKKEVQNQNKILRNILIFLGAFVLAILIIVFGLKEIRNADYEGVDFEVVTEGDLLLYRTSIPVHYNGGLADYNFYLRENPKDLKEIEFSGDLWLENNMVLNLEQDFNCDGDGIIGVANLLKLYEIYGANVIADENASCGEGYMHVSILEDSEGETRIDQYGGNACYNIYVNDCEILRGTERFMLETFVELDKML